MKEKLIQRLHSGHDIDPLNVKPADIMIEDIAHGLSMTCRFAGQCKQFYSVAQHSVLVSNLVPPPMGLCGLLHDSPEAYLTDIYGPLKQYLPNYVAIENHFMAVIAERFGLPLVIPGAVHDADRIALATELAALMTDADSLFTREPILPEPANVIIQSLDWPRAKFEFLNRFMELTAPGNELVPAGDPMLESQGR